MGFPGIFDMVIVSAVCNFRVYANADAANAESAGI